MKRVETRKSYARPRQFAMKKHTEWPALQIPLQDLIFDPITSADKKVGVCTFSTALQQIGFPGVL